MLWAAIPWFLPVLAATYLVVLAPGSEYDGIPYGVVILGSVAAFGFGSLVAAGVDPRRRMDRTRIVMVLGFGLAGLTVALVTGEAARLAHTGLRGQTLLVLGLFGGWILAGGRLSRVSGRRPSAFAVLVVVAVAAMVETDLRLVHTVFERDLLLYLRAGSAMLHGLPTYSSVVLTQEPADPTLLPFVYPPVTLPFLAVLSIVPAPLLELVWLVLGVGASVAALRCLGVRWSWVPVLLLWPPFIQGLWTGNANIFLLLAFAAAPYAPALLALPPLVKIQLGITTLWLARERRWRDVGRGLGLVALLLLATLPIVGFAAWQDWLGALGAFAQTAANIHAIEGVALTRFTGPTIAVAVAGLIVAIALLRKGRDGLATLGLASLTISPTLYLHGLTLGLAGLLRLRGAVLWFLLALTASFIHGQNWWLLVAIVVLAPLIPMLVKSDKPDAAVHPIGPNHQVWPGNPFSRSGRQP